ncbi:MAG: hypothetical protein QM500_19480 [Methylococcales bacterium]
MALNRFIEEQNFICGGWTNASMIDDEPASYDTAAEVANEVWDFFDEINSQIASGNRSEEDGYDPAEFRIKDTETDEIFSFEFFNDTDLLLVQDSKGDTRLAKDFSQFQKPA